MPTYPIHNLSVESFGPFHSLDIKFSAGLNVIIGENAAGKTQLLKLLYSATKALNPADSRSESLTKKSLNIALADKLMGVFRPDSLGRLTRRVRGQSRAEVEIKYSGIGQTFAFGFSSHAKKEVQTSSVPTTPLKDQPVFLPPQELLSLPNTFISMFDAYDTGFEETWRDTAELLWRPALRGPREKKASNLIVPILERLRGDVFEYQGRFYLKQQGVGNLESALLADGHRKLAMLARLVANGVLLEGGYLFWDEPEANLNPALLQTVASVLLQLARNGVQIFVSTHSLYLLRELQMLSTDCSDVNPTYIGLIRKDDSEEDDVVAESRDDLDEISYVASFRAELEQADRYLGW
ncbi:AAA family ATPase [Trueperella pyogenes]|uniref:AAA family ATPase n=1 Tax=Trueperella pyogenes TaxID=1661 RepID=UPI00345CB215